MQLGVENPRNHMVIVRKMGAEGGEGPDGVGTILLSREPFSEQDVDTIEAVTERLQFEMVLSPRFSLDSNFATIASGQNLQEFTANFPINIEAPTDNSPFFFHMLRLRNIFNRELTNQGTMSFNMKAVSTLGVLLIVVIVLTFLCIMLPIMLTAERPILKGAMPLFVFFTGIGLGFMFVEVSQMQRLIVFLGHPTYGLSIVLFSLLISSGLGSYSTHRVGDSSLGKSAVVRLALLLGLLGVFGLVTAPATRAFQGSGTLIRILVAIVTLMPIGFFMGMAFPLGMKVASRQARALTPWFWGVNGAMSVCASVFGVAIALTWGISALFWTGFVCYGLACLAFLGASWGKISPISSI